MGEYPPQGQGVATASLVFSAGVSTLGNTSGTTGTISRQLILVGGNNITLSENINGASATVTISAFDQSIQTQSAHVHGVSGQTAGTGTALLSTGTIVIAGGNNITLSQDANTITISAFNLVNSNNISFGTNGNSVTATATFSAVQQLNDSSGTMSIVSGNNISIHNNNSTISVINRLSSGANIQDVSSVTQAGTNTFLFAKDDHIHRGVFQVQISGNISNTSNPIYGSVVFAGGNNITLSQVSALGAATITISAFNQSIQSAVQQLNGSSGTMSIVAGNNISIHNNNSTISVINLLSTATIVSSVTSANVIGVNSSRFALEDHQHAGVRAAGVTNIGNVSGNTTVLPGQLVLAGGNNITLSQSTSNNNNMTITISGANWAPTVSRFTTPDLYAFTGGISNAALSLRPFQIPFYMSVTEAEIMVDMIGHDDHSGGISFSAGIYTMTGSTANLASSTSQFISWTSGTATTATSIYGGQSGARFRVIEGGYTWNITPGEYLMGIWLRTDDNDIHLTIFGMSSVSFQDVEQLSEWHPGYFSTSFASAMPASIHVTRVIKTGASVMRQCGFELEGTF